REEHRRRERDDAFLHLLRRALSRNSGPFWFPRERPVKQAKPLRKGGFPPRRRARDYRLPMESMIEQVIEPRRHDLGGFEVERVLPFRARRMVGPFVFFDRMGPH